jgi:hypothetical protein
MAAYLPGLPMPGPGSRERRALTRVTVADRFRRLPGQLILNFVRSWRMLAESARYCA